MEGIRFQWNLDLPGSKIMEKEIIDNVCDVCHIV